MARPKKAAETVEGAFVAGPMRYMRAENGKIVTYAPDTPIEMPDAAEYEAAIARGFHPTVVEEVPAPAAE